MVRATRQSLCVACVLTASFALAARPPLCAEEAAHAQRVLGEYRNALTVLEKRSRRIQVEGSRNTWIKTARAGSTKGPGKYEMLVSYCVSDDCERYTLTNERAGNYLNRVFVRTEGREFGLRRRLPHCTFLSGTGGARKLDNVASRRSEGSNSELRVLRRRTVDVALHGPVARLSGQRGITGDGRRENFLPHRIPL